MAAAPWASRAAGIGGEAASAGKVLRQNVLAAASILQADPKTLDIAGIVVDAESGRERMELDEVARVVYFRPDTCRPAFRPSSW